jgi:hypothetical protein
MRGSRGAEARRGSWWVRYVWSVTAIVRVIGFSPLAGENSTLSLTFSMPPLASVVRPVEVGTRLSLAVPARLTFVRRSKTSCFVPPFWLTFTVPGAGTVTDTPKLRVAAL